MRRVAVILVVALAVGAVVGIVNAVLGTPEGTSGSPGGTASAEPTPTTGPKPSLPSQPALPIAIADASATPDGMLRVGYYVGLPACYAQLADARVDERSSSVRVALFTGLPPTKSARACPDLAVYKQTTLRLRRPLGDRAVIDDSTGDPVPASGRSAQ